MNISRHHALPLATLACAVTLLRPIAWANPPLDELFANPPQVAKPQVMWMWMGSDPSNQGITRDLEALHEAGFGGKER